MRMASPSPICNAAASHRSGEQQQPGADFEMRRFGGSPVDVEANFAFLEMKPYHSAVRKEVRGFSHCENRHAVQTLENGGLSPGFVSAEKEDVAALDFLRLAYQADMEYAGADGLAFDGALEFLAARFVVKDAQAEGWVSGIESTRWPGQKLREMEKKQLSPGTHRQPIGCGQAAALLRQAARRIAARVSGHRPEFAWNTLSWSNCSLLDT